MRTRVGQYRIEAPIGRGGMGVVYRGVHDHLGRPVAVKALAPELTQQPEFKERFFAEAKTQARLQHPNIVGVYDLIEDGGEFFIVMELVDGQGLEERLKASAGQGLELQEAFAIFSQMLTALDHAHSEGVIHRDIKPSNVLITETGRVKLTDFGIALLIGDKRLTASQSAIGTPTYMSPEQIVRPRSVDHRADLYSAAVVFFEMLAGQPPFDDETEYGIKKLHVEAPPPDLSILNPDLPPGVAHAVATALAKDPDDRFASAGLFLKALQESMGGMPTSAPFYALPATSTSSRRTDSRPVELRAATNRKAAVGAAAGLVLLLGLGAFVLSSRGGREAAADDPPPAAQTPTPEPVLVAQATPEPVLPAANAASSVPAQPALPTPPRAPAPPKPARRSLLESTPLPPPEPTPAPSPEVVAQPAVPAVPEAGPEPAPAGKGVDQFKEMEELVLSVESLGNKALEAYGEEGREDQLLNRLDSFAEATASLRKEFRKVTGTGVRGFGQNVKNVFRRSGKETDTRTLEIKVEDLTRRAAEIDSLMGSSPPGQTTMDYWKEMQGNLRRLQAYF
jgi:eukaryotic-like serine/threonine-protein kinase